MRKTFIVLRHEFVTAVGRPSFWLTTVLFPLLILLFSFGPQWMGQKTMEERTLSDVRDTASGQMLALFTKPSGYVDKAGIIEGRPPSMPPGWFIAYEDEDAANADLEAGKIGRYYVIAADYVESGKVLMVTPPLDPLMRQNARQVFTFFIDYNLLHDEARAARLLIPLPKVRTETLVERQVVDEASPDTMMLPMGMMMLFLMLIAMSSGFVLDSVVREKEDRTAEIMLSSLDARQLMAGKLAGMGLVAFLQVAIWLGAMALISRQGRLWTMLRQATALSPSTLLWAGIYFILGYIAYAAEMGALGTLVPSRRESGSITFFILLPMLVPAWMSQPMIEAPNGPLATALSLFPLSAPVAMPTRMMLVVVPLWQRVAAAVGLLATAWLLTVLAARFFRADTLLSTQALNWRRFRQAWRGKG